MWLDDDREWALAAHLNAVDTCGGCGQPFSESIDPANEGRYATTAMRCHACASLGASTAAALDGVDPKHTRGLTFHVHHKDD